MSHADPPPAQTPPAYGYVLLASVFILAICGLAYELLASTLSSYLLGDSVQQFSLTIGLFLTAMGIGSFLTRWIHRHLLVWLIGMELAVGVIGGLTALLGFLAFAYTDLYQPILMGIVLLIGALIGMEIPLVVRILRDVATLRVTMANVLGVDYVGALLGAILFPFVLLPLAGLAGAAVLCGLANVLVASAVLWVFRRQVGRAAGVLAPGALVSAGVLIIALLMSHRWVHQLEDSLYQDQIIYAHSSPYQRIIITRYRDDLRLYLNGHLQFATIDEARYHEALVHPAMSGAREPRRVLILGGGDGLAAREVFKHPSVEQIDLVDIDATVTDLFRDHETLAALNGGSLRDPRLTIHNFDAFKFLENTTAMYDVILVDLPDPSEPALAKLYSRAFYTLIARRLSAHGRIAVQATSPFRSRETFWCIVHTLDAVALGPEGASRLHVKPYQMFVPTFGLWGFALAGFEPFEPTLDPAIDTQTLTPEVLPGLFAFPKDCAEVPTPINGLNDPIIVELYQRNYRKHFE